MGYSNGILPDTESSGHPIFQLFAMFTSTLSIISSGMHYGWPSPSLPKLQAENSTISITNHEGSWVAVMPLAGACVGSIVGGFILDVVGRKKVILLTSFPFFASWIMVAYAKSVEILLAARFIAGIADGLAFCAVPMYLGEIADSKIRGLLGSSCSVSWIFGMLLINTLGSYCSVSITALVSSAFPVLLLVTFMWMPESPYFLIMKGQQTEAQRSLKIFRGSKTSDAELERLSVAIKEQNTDTGKFFDLFTVKSNRKAVLIMMGIRAVQQCSGTMAITFYTQDIFKNAGDDISPTTASIIYFAVQLVMTSISSMIVDKTGRRPLLIFSIIGAGVCLLVDGLYFYFQDDTSLNIKQYSIIPVIALILFVVVFGMGLQAIPILLLGELFPTNVKAFALGFADIYYNILATIVSKFFQIVKDHHGIHVPFFVFSACCAFGLLFILFCIPETKGKTLEEIQIELRGNSKPSTAPSTPVQEENTETFKQIAEV